jgi:hypothetical protein
MKKIYIANDDISGTEEDMWDTEARDEIREKSRRMKSAAHSAYQSIAQEISKKYKLINFEDNLRKFSR